MSSAYTVINGGGKYRVKLERAKDNTAYHLHVSVLDWGAGVTLMFDTLDQVSAFLSDANQATLACASKVSSV